MDPSAGLGTTNAAFNWAVTLGDVVRVVPLFYLMPLWAVLLARLVLREPLTHHAAARVLLVPAGAAVVLWPAGRSGWRRCRCRAHRPTGWACWAASASRSTT